MTGFFLLFTAIYIIIDGNDSVKAETSEQKTQLEAYQKQKSKIKELEGSEWDVTLVSADGKSKTSEEDKLVFKAGTVNLKSFEKKGYPAVGYTVTPDPDGEGSSWENFQETKDGSLAIYGHWEKDSMTGSVREYFEKGKKVQAYSFSSTAKSTLKPDNPVQDAPDSQMAESPASSGTAQVLVSKET